QIAQQVAQFGRENYHILSLTFGEPPVTFNFSYRDKDNNFHSDANISPKDFYAKYIGWDLSEYVSIINAPTADKPFNQTYGVKMLGSVVGGREVKHLNLDLSTFKDLAVKQLLAGENVWFGVDMGPKLDRAAGLMDTKLYNEDDLFDVDFSMTKAERLEFGDSLMTHAMVLTGVDLVDGKPTKWKVENSWGDKNGHKGYFTMSDEWFDEFTYQVVIKKEHLPAELRDIYENTMPYELAPWDPMGALA
ncbi:MAG: C1 family peptidase, partial [Weissella confusa]|nr:C1 family peptidase [Weissella confusa]